MGMPGWQINPSNMTSSTYIITVLLFINMHAILST